jgi:tripartite-type tricarboxylate transporter receptor subunit TctC
VRILQLPELKKRMDQDGMVVVASTPEAFRDFFARETEKFARVIETAGIKGTL